MISQYEGGEKNMIFKEYIHPYIVIFLREYPQSNCTLYNVALQQVKGITAPISIGGAYIK